MPVHSCVIDSEAIVCNDAGLAVFDLIRRRPSHLDAVLCAFDLIELDGTDLRREPIEKRKRFLQRLLGGANYGIAYNEHFETEGAIVYREACALGCEGIVSARPHRSGRSDHWLKVKNPVAPAMRREAEEAWS